MIATCKCQHCGQPVEFEMEGWSYGQTQACASCGQVTRTQLPRRKMGFDPNPEKSNPQNVLVWIYLGVVLMPLVGFFGGIYLLAKNQPGHGATAMAGSVIMVLIWTVVLTNL